jgi:thiamine pyrophosphate-dependent acetolactate synthase large subunit-like protein
MDILSASWTENGEIRAIIDGLEVVAPPGTRHYNDIVASGISISPHQPQPPSKAAYEAAIQYHIDAAAKSKSYDGGASIVGYAASTIPQWAAEAQSFIAWRDNVWTYALAELAKVEARQREQPTIAEFVAELPLIIWP